MVNLIDHKQAVREECLRRNSHKHINNKYIDEAIEHFCNLNLRYSKGKTFEDSFGKISEYVNKEEIPTYETSEEASIWEFTGIIRSEAGIINTNK